MNETTYNPDLSHDQEELERSVSIDGKHLGREMQTFNLSSLESNMLGADAFTQVIIETTSGNQYLIYKAGHDWAIVDARSNEGKGFGNMKGTFLEQEDMENGELTIGKSFKFGKSGSTSEITKITGINENRQYHPDDLEKEAKSDARDKFKASIMPKQKE